MLEWPWDEALTVVGVSPQPLKRSSGTVNQHGGAMKIRSLLAALAFALTSSIAFAAHCPMDMKQIDEALSKNPNISADKLAEVKKYRAEGEQLHKAGKHQESVDTLAKAKKLLGI
jgi:hypothetical protein